MNLLQRRPTGQADRFLSDVLNKKKMKNCKMEDTIQTQLLQFVEQIGKTNAS